MRAIPKGDRLIEVFALGIVVVLLLGHGLGQPVLVSYVETGSMEPTLTPNDGFLVVPPQLAGGAKTGDVVIFRAERLRGGGLTTHRIVGETDHGYLTKGDANSQVDQAGIEPPVQSPQIVGQALTIGGQVVVLPHVGTVVTGIKDSLAGGQRYLAHLTGLPLRTNGVDLASLLVVLGLSLIIIGYIRDDEKPAPSQWTSPPGHDGPSGRRIVFAAAGGLVIIATLSMVIQGGVHPISVVSAENDAPGLRVIESGETETTVYQIRNSGPLPQYAVIESRSNGIEVRPEGMLTVPPGENLNATVAVSAPPEIGYYRMYFLDHRYLGILPKSVIGGLYDVHPWAPIVAIDVVIGLATVLVGRWLLGWDSLRSRLGPTGPPTPGGGRR